MIGIQIAYLIFINCNMVVSGIVQAILLQFVEKIPNKIIKAIENKNKIIFDFPSCYHIGDKIGILNIPSFLTLSSSPICIDTN